MIGPVRPLAVAGLVLSASAVLAAAYPWQDVVGHSHWSRVGWIPFVSWPAPWLDIAGNLLLFVPVGVFAGLSFARVIPTTLFIALALSVFVETMQLYSHSRFPSATDVVCNVAGAVAAAAFVRDRQLRGSRTPVT
jgi:hypothetical protein